MDFWGEMDNINSSLFKQKLTEFLCPTVACQAGFQFLKAGSMLHQSGKSEPGQFPGLFDMLGTGWTIGTCYSL